MYPTPSPWYNCNGWWHETLCYLPCTRLDEGSLLQMCTSQRRWTVHCIAGVQHPDSPDREWLQGDHQNCPVPGQGQLAGSGQRNAADPQHAERSHCQTPQGDPWTHQILEGKNKLESVQSCWRQDCLCTECWRQIVNYITYSVVCMRVCMQAVLPYAHWWRQDC